MLFEWLNIIIKKQGYITKAANNLGAKHVDDDQKLVVRPVKRGCIQFP